MGEPPGYSSPMLTDASECFARQPDDGPTLPRRGRPSTVVVDEYRIAWAARKWQQGEYTEKAVPVAAGQIQDAVCGLLRVLGWEPARLAEEVGVALAGVYRWQAGRPMAPMSWQTLTRWWFARRQKVALEFAVAELRNTMVPMQVVADAWAACGEPIMVSHGQKLSVAVARCFAVAGACERALGK